MQGRQGQLANRGILDKKGRMEKAEEREDAIIARHPELRPAIDENEWGKGNLVQRMLNLGFNLIHSYLFYLSIKFPF